MRTLIVSLLFIAGSATGVWAAEEAYRITIENHIFTPSEIRIPAQKKVKLVIENKDSSAEEFESYELNREKMVPAKGQAVVFVGPLKPGRYPFFGEFNPKTAQGAVIAE